jgi:tetratricopeptide (TPR) repeat protein
MSWDEIVLTGLRYREDFSRVVAEAAEAAPPHIKEILITLPDLLNLDQDKITALEKEYGPALVLLYYFWSSLCGEYYQEVPLEMQRDTLKNGLHASIAGGERASHMNEKEIEVRFLFEKGSILYNLNRFSQAEKILNKTCEAYRRLSRSNPVYIPHFTKSLTLLGNCYCRTGAFSEAIKAYTQALTTVEQPLKESHHAADGAMILYNLGNLYRTTNTFLEAEKCYKKALCQYKELAKIDPDFYARHVVVTLLSLGNFYWSTNNFSEAENTYSKAVKKLERLTKKHPGIYNPLLAKTLSNMGNVYSMTGNFQQAEHTYQRALSIRKKLAEETPEIYNLDLAMNVSNLGILYSSMGKFSKAEKKCFEALTIMENINEDSIALQSCRVHTLHELGTIHQALNKVSQAKELYTAALNIYAKLAQYSPDDLGTTGQIKTHTKEIQGPLNAVPEKISDIYSPDTGKILTSLGTLYWSINDFENAEKAYIKALELYESCTKDYPDVHADVTADILDKLGTLYKDAHKYAEAEKAYTKAFDVLRRLAEKHPSVYNVRVAMILNNLGTFYWIITQFSEAEKAYTKALDVLRGLAETYPRVYSRDVAMISNNMGTLYSEMGYFEKGQKMYRKALTIYEELAHVYPEAYEPDVAMTLTNVGDGYLRTTNAEKAEPPLSEALQKYRELAGETPDAYEPYVVIALKNLGNSYLRIKTLEKAEPLFDEAATIAKERKLWFELADIYDSMSHFLSNKREDAVKALELGILWYGEKKYKYAQKGRREKLYTGLLERIDDPKKGFGILEALRDSDLLSLAWGTEIEKMRNLCQETTAEVLLRERVHPLLPRVHIPGNTLFVYIQKMRDCILYLVITQKEMHLFRGSSEFARIGQKLLVNLRVQTIGGIRNKNISSIITRYDNLTTRWAATLPPELQRMLSEKDVIIFSPDGIISYFPLEGLSICDEPICLTKKVMRAASIHQAQKIASRVELDSSLIVGNPWPSVDEQSLSYTYPSRIGPIGYLKEAEKEAQMLAEHMPGPHVFMGSHAVRDEVLRALPHHSLIHFAGHGYLGRVLFFAGPMVGFPPEFEPEEFAQLRRAWRMTNGSITHMMDEWDTDIDILDRPYGEEDPYGYSVDTSQNSQLDYDYNVTIMSYSQQPYTFYIPIPLSSSGAPDDEKPSKMISEIVKNGDIEFEVIDTVHGKALKIEGTGNASLQTVKNVSFASYANYREYLTYDMSMHDSESGRKYYWFYRDSTSNEIFIEFKFYYYVGGPEGGTLCNYDHAGWLANGWNLIKVDAEWVTGDGFSFLESSEQDEYTVLGYCFIVLVVFVCSVIIICSMFLISFIGFSRFSKDFLALSIPFPSFLIEIFILHPLHLIMPPSFI